MAYQATNPYNGQVVATFDELNDAQLEAKLATAATCFRNNWSDKPFSKRKAELSRAAGLMRERSQALASLITLRWAS